MQLDRGIGLYPAAGKAAIEQVIFGWAEELCAALDRRSGVSGPRWFGNTYTVIHDPLV